MGGPPGGGFWRGKTDVQAPRRVAVRNWALEGLGSSKKTCMSRSHTPSPVGRRIEAPLGGVPPPNVFGVRRVAIRKGV